MKNRLKLFFTILFFITATYIIMIKTEKFQSKSIIMIKDLSKKQSANSLGAMILPQSFTKIQDTKILEIFIRSNRMFNFLDKKFNLKRYYSGNQIDLYQRLSENAIFPFYQATKENLLTQYNKDLLLIYDEPSNTLEISFAHADSRIAQQIIKSIIQYSIEIINLFEKENANVALSFLITQEKKNKELFIDTIKKLITYQNLHSTIDPNIDIKSKSGIQANLESILVGKEVEYKSKLQYMNKNTPEMKLLQNSLINIQKGIKKIKAQMAGSSEDNNELNIDLFDFELLKNEMDFNKERYKQTLIKLEELKIEVNQNTKNLIVISSPSIAEDYTYPEKLKNIITLLIILSFLYGILTLIITLINEHKD